MARCGCTSVPASGVSILDTETINVSGAGTGGSPFEMDVKRSADAGNLLEEHADGLWLGNSGWTTYTPAWAAAGGSPAIGNGTLAGRYLKIGKLVFLRIELIGGSTTNWSTGVIWTFSLPAGLAAPGSSNIAEQAALNAVASDSSASDVFNGVATLGVSGTTVGVVLDDNGATPNISLLGSATPFTWASGDYLRIVGWFELA